MAESARVEIVGDVVRNALGGEVGATADGAVVEAADAACESGVGAPAARAGNSLRIVVEAVAGVLVGTVVAAARQAVSASRNSIAGNLVALK